MQNVKSQQVPVEFEMARMEGEGGPPSTSFEASKAADRTRVNIRRLNQLRAGELAAATTYDAVITRLARHGVAGLKLLETLEDHRHRAARLAELVIHMGGTLQNEPGSWGFFENMAEPMAMTASETMAVALLKEGEEFGVREYTTALERLELPARAVLENELLPEQIRAHHEIDELLTTLREQPVRSFS